MRNIYILSLVFLVISVGNSQDPAGKIAHYDFNGCVLTEIVGNFGDGIINGEPGCVCGSEGDAFEFDGVDDFVDFGNDINTVFDSDFTISFYFREGNSTEPVDIISYRPTCTRDSSFSIRYIPAINEINVELSESVSNRAVTRGTLDDSNCWHWLVYTRSVFEYKLYLDGVLIDEDMSSRQLELNDTVTLSIGNSPCVGLSDVRFDGRIDDLKFWDRALDETEIEALDQKVDQIITTDTTIFAGDMIPIEVGNTCSSGFNWSPITGLSDPGLLTPEAGPDESTTYTLSFNHPDCSTSDQITINIIDPSDIDCDNLLLPGAFTPNGDGLNDVYGISNAFIIDEVINFEIFNRWGARIFQSTNKNATWNGSYEGQAVNPGMLVYKVTYTCGGQERIKVGSFSVLR